MKLGDLVRRKHFGYYQIERMKRHDPTYDPNQIYHVIEISEFLGALKLLNTKTGEIECIPNAQEYYETIDEE